MDDIVAAIFSDLDLYERWKIPIAFSYYSFRETHSCMLLREVLSISFLWFDFDFIRLEDGFAFHIFVCVWFDIYTFCGLKLKQIHDNQTRTTTLLIWFRCC